MRNDVAAFLVALCASTILACGRAALLATPSPSERVYPSPPPLSSPTLEPVPAEQQSRYKELSEILSAYEPYRQTAAGGLQGDTLLGAELIVANGNRGEALLGPMTLSGVDLFLDRLQEIGVRGVSISIATPLLDPSFPRHDEYLDFYKNVVEAVRARGLVVCVEVGPAFTGTAFSSVEYDWSSLTLDDYFDMKRSEIVLIARDLKPDYLAFGGEPDTEMMLTGLTYSVEQYLEFVRTAAAQVDRSTGMLVGAGSGSWDSPAYLDRLSLEPSIDFVNIHIYPMSNGFSDYIETASEAAARARARGKKVIIGEAWLYKATPHDLRSGIGYADVYARDVYGFWAPLDIRFIQTIAGLAEGQGVDYVSFFWSGYFFSYLAYEDIPQDLSTSARFKELNRAQLEDILAGNLSPTGVWFQSFLRSGPSP